MVKVHRNARAKQTSHVPTNPAKAPERPPEAAKAPEKPAPHRKADKGGKFTMTKQERSDGFGLYMCKNCRWYKKARPPREESCKEMGVAESTLPCVILRQQHGHFEPIRMGQAKAVKISHLDPGELLILTYRARLEAVKQFRENLRNFRIGDRVQYYLNGQLFYGEVARLTKRYVIIDPDHGGGEVTLKPIDVAKEEDGDA